MTTTTAQNTSTNLSGVFFAPNYNKMLPYMIEAYKSFQYRSDATPEKIAMRIIGKYYSEYAQNCSLCKSDKFGRKDGDFNLESMLKEISIFCKLVELRSFFNRPSYYGIGEFGVDKLWYSGIAQLYKPVTCTHEDNSVFAVAVGSEVIKTSDADCYETAGGYRCYESDEKPVVYLSVGHHGISLHVASYMTVDHYNNNFAGVSTGNGTTTYAKGEKPCIRVINTMMYSVKEVCEKYNLNLRKMDCSRGTNALSAYSL